MNQETRDLTDTIRDCASRLDRKDLEIQQLKTALVKILKLHGLKNDDIATAALQIARKGLEQVK